MTRINAAFALVDQIEDRHLRLSNQGRLGAASSISVIAKPTSYSGVWRKK
jgi:hypothetical protein